MAKIILNIDGAIGQWGYSKQWLTQMLDGHDNDEVDLIISSPGGSVDHALAMHDRIALHPKNTKANLFGFVASAATVVAMGANKRTMSSNAFFLVHKVLTWIDVFGVFNDDDLEMLIEQFKKEKNEQAKMTLQIAKIYAGITGKPVKDLLELMKEDTWLSADEALDWGFIDEIQQISGKQENIFQDLSKVAMLTANGLPMPTRNNKPQTPNNKPQKPQNAMITNLVHINEILGIEGLETSDEGSFLNQDALQSINDRLTTIIAERDTAITERDTAITERDNINTDLTNLGQRLAQTETERDTAITERDTATTECDTAITERDTAITERDTANTELQNNETALNAIGQTVADATGFTEKVAAVKKMIAAKPGVKPIGNNTTSDPHTNAVDGVDWDTINNLEHNQTIH